MKVEDFKLTLAALIADACKCYLKEVGNRLSGERVYAFTIYCASGCESIGAAVASDESLLRRNAKGNVSELLAFFNKMNADEWEHSICIPGLFAKANQLIDQFYDSLFEGDFEDHEFSEHPRPSELDAFSESVFVEVVVNVLRRLKIDDAFASHGLTGDLLLGLQFIDPSGRDADMMEKVSMQLNSPFWHKQVVRNCGYLREAK